MREFQIAQGSRGTGIHGLVNGIERNIFSNHLLGMRGVAAFSCYCVGISKHFSPHRPSKPKISKITQNLYTHSILVSIFKTRLTVDRQCFSVHEHRYHMPLELSIRGVEFTAQRPCIVQFPPNCSTVNNFHNGKELHPKRQTALPWKLLPIRKVGGSPYARQLLCVRLIRGFLSRIQTVQN